MSALGWKKKRRHFEENEINDGESPLADTPAGPSGVFINSSRIQLVGLFVRRFSLTPPSCRSFTNSVPLFRPVMYAISFPIYHLSLSFSFLKKADYRKVKSFFVILPFTKIIVQLIIYFCKRRITFSLLDASSGSRKEKAKSIKYKSRNISEKQCL